MSDALDKAARDAVAAADNAEQLRLITAVLQAQQLLNQQPQAPAPAPVAPRRPLGTYVTLAVAGAGAVTALAMAAALLAVAVAIGGTCATVCLLVLRSMWRDFQKDD